MKILFVHQNFPGQFKHLAPALAKAGHEVRSMGIEGQPIPGIPYHRYRLLKGNQPQTPALLQDFETKLIRAEACASAALRMKAEGFTPDLIVCHPGWGETLFLKDVWLGVRMLSFLEFYYSPDGPDVNFEEEFIKPELKTDPAAALHERARLRTKNTNNLLSMEQMDWGLSPTNWQKSQIPRLFHDRISVIFDGIDTKVVRPNLQAHVHLKTLDRTLKVGDEVITFVNRNLEPYRGYHIMMRALPEIQRLRPNAITVIVGGNDVSYGARSQDGRSWRDVFLDEVRGHIDLEKVRFVGKLPYPAYLNLIQVSACHVYLTYPFVLSWSCIESMSVGGLLVASDTAPVREVVEHGRNGLLVDFHDPQGLAETVANALERRDSLSAMRAQARQDIIDRYDLSTICLPRQLELVERVARM